MARFYFILFCFVSLSFSLKAQSYDKNCFYGISFDVSKSPNWGFGELVVTDVEPNSPASKAGIKVDDIIMEINGKATYLRDNNTIASWLFDFYDPNVKFTIRNMNSYFKEYELNRLCVNVNSISEQQLSEIFEFYSLENTSSRTFSLPIKVTALKEADFSDYHTFDFYHEDGKDVPLVDAYISDIISRELQAKGMVQDTNDPDIIIQSYYSYTPNSKYRDLLSTGKGRFSVSRFDKDNERMITMPAIDASKYNAEEAGLYNIEYGFSFYEKKIIKPGTMTQIWDCNITEYLSSKYSIKEYARIMTHLMLMQFPFTRLKNNSTYEVKFNKYNYTGIFYNSDNLTTVQDVAEGSPAFNAGIRAGYVIKKIDNKTFNHTRQSLTERYKEFVSKTMGFRDQGYKFSISRGYNNCMFWNRNYYANIAKEFANPAYETNFSYLYEFEPYVRIKSSNSLTIEAWDGYQKRIFKVTPEVRQSINIKLKNN